MKKRNENITQDLMFLAFNPITDKGNQVIGSGSLTLNCYIEVSNIVGSEYSENTTINDGSVTTDEMINKHIKKYSKVWESLA